MIKNPLSWLPIASGLFVLVLTLAVGVLTVSSRQTQNLTTKASDTPATLALTPALGDYTLTTGGTYPISVLIDAAGKNIDGFDVIINFDPKKVQVVENRVASTTLFEQFPLNVVDNQKGQIRFSGLTFKPSPTAGIVGTFRIRPLAKGEVTLNFDFTRGATVDSNIAENGTAKDILGSVINGKYQFK